MFALRRQKVMERRRCQCGGEGEKGGGRGKGRGGMCLGFPVPSFLSRLSFKYTKRKLCSHYVYGVHQCTIFRKCTLSVYSVLLQCTATVFLNFLGDQESIPRIDWAGTTTLFLLSKIPAQSSNSWNGIENMGKNCNVFHTECYSQTQLWAKFVFNHQ